MGLVGIAVAPTLPVAVVAVGMVGFGFSLSFPVLTGTLQLEVPDAVRGRIMAYHQTAHLGNRPIAALLVGGLAAAVGAQPAAIAGAVLAPIGLLATRRAWRMLAARQTVPDPAAPVRAVPGATSTPRNGSVEAEVIESVEAAGG